MAWQQAFPLTEGPICLKLIELSTTRKEEEFKFKPSSPHRENLFSVSRFDSKETNEHQKLRKTFAFAILEVENTICTFSKQVVFEIQPTCTLASWTFLRHLAQDRYIIHTNRKGTRYRLTKTNSKNLSEYLESSHNKILKSSLIKKAKFKRKKV